jgi:hypothetical protein
VSIDHPDGDLYTCAQCPFKDKHAHKVGKNEIVCDQSGEVVPVEEARKFTQCDEALYLQPPDEGSLTAEELLEALFGKRGERHV